MPPVAVASHPVNPVYRRKLTRHRRTLRKTLLGFIGAVGFLATWQMIPMLGIIKPQYLPYATDTLAWLGAQFVDLAFWRNVGHTMTAWAIGLVIATVLAIVLGGIIGMTPFLRRATHSMVEFLRPIPSVALIPLAVLLYGFQLPAALIIIVYATFWQVFVQVLYGVADIDAVARDTANSYRIPRRTQLTSLVFPTVLPYLMTGLRLAAAVALILAVTAEMTIGNPGLGAVINTARNAGNSVVIYGIVVMTGLLGVTINLVFLVIERRSLSWHQSVRGEEAL